MQERERKVMDPLQAILVPTYWYSLFSQGTNIKKFLINFHLLQFNQGKVQKLKDRQFGRVQPFVPHKNPSATIGNI